MPMTDPEALVFELFQQLEQKAKSSRPIDTSGKSVTKNGFVYTELVSGMLVHPDDYTNAWTPIGGSSAAGVAPAAAAATSSGSGTAAAPAPNPKVQKALQAALNTAMLVDNMLQVTDDSSYVEYPISRHLSTTYENILAGMQSTPMPLISADVQAQIDAATKVLYELDDDGSILTKSKLYKNYLKNAAAYAKAKSDYADAQVAALANPAKADSWPMNSTTYQQAVDDAYDSLKTEGAEKIERARDIIESIGVSMQAHMIAKARKIYDAYSLGLTGVPVQIPYSSISPSDWADPDGDVDGWETLTISKSDYAKHMASDSRFHSQAAGQSSSSTSSAGGSYWFASGSGTMSSADSAHQSSSDGFNFSRTNEEASNMKLTAQWGMCTINRYWFNSDLFYTNGWYLVNNPANAISDGTIDNQIRNETPLIPMIPMQFMVLRNVNITAEKWGTDALALSSQFSNAEDSSHTDSKSGSLSYGGLGISAHASHSDSHASNQNAANSGADSRGLVTNFDSKSGLSINGSQIIAFLCDIVPPAPRLPDPSYKPPKKKTTDDSMAGDPNAPKAAQPQPVH
jgi:hypothetical protein